MGRKCCVPGCSSNYGTSPYVASFIFPKELERKQLWIKSINRANFEPSATAVVCIYHFDDRFIIREDKVTRDDGSLLVVQRSRLALTKDAYPTVFPNQPSYLTKELPIKRKSPSKRLEHSILRDEKSFEQWCSDDDISSFEELTQKCKAAVNPNWLFLIREDFVLFYRIADSECPKIAVSMKVFQDLSVKVWNYEIEVAPKTLEWVLGAERKCNKWSKFDCILSHLMSFSIQDLTFEQKIKCVNNILVSCSSNCESDEKETRLHFLSEQLKLLCVKKITYSCDTILWAAKIYFSFPSAYSLIRNSNIFTIPHPQYLKRLLNSLSCTGSGNDNDFSLYLKRKATVLNENEKLVNVILDEIYVTPYINYTAGHIIGVSENLNSEATTVQAFMIDSVFSKNKDVVSLVPVKNITAQSLFTYTSKVLKLLHESGFIVLCLISDNNRVNRNMFTLMCDGDLKPYINNPYCNDKKLFFVFDTVHLIKAVRNNWLNQISQTFYYPHPNDHSKICAANLSHLKEIYESEKNKIVKQAPRLSQKVLFPTSTERQNATHALNLFHESNVVALTVNSDRLGCDGTKDFIEHILRWWKIVNVKHPEKGMLSRDKYSLPIKTLSDENILFLQNFSSWLSAWGKIRVLKVAQRTDLGLPSKGGMLSKETQFAMEFTTNSLLEIAMHVFDTISPQYLLLGKFQSDNLEARFGQYRQMSGGNYHISYKQVLESEHKLQVLSFISLYSERMGTFHVKDFDFHENVIQETCEIPKQFYSVFNTHNDIYISESVMSVLIYIAGYVAHKVCQNINCEDCHFVVCKEKDLEVDCSKEVYLYLKLSDRGGLKWPEEFTLNIVLRAYQIFQKLISREYEEDFLKFGNQKELLLNLVLENIDLVGIIENVTCKCGNDRMFLCKQCISVIVNIFLNNYTKKRNDKSKLKNCKRKISVFSYDF